MNLFTILGIALIISLALIAMIFLIYIVISFFYNGQKWFKKSIKDKEDSKSIGVR